MVPDVNLLGPTEYDTLTFLAVVEFFLEHHELEDNKNFRRFLIGHHIRLRHRLLLVLHPYFLKS